MNAIVIAGKPVEQRSIEIGGIDSSDYPDFCDAYIDAAQFEEGTPLNDTELEQLGELYNELIRERAIETCQLYYDKRFE